MFNAGGERRCYVFYPTKTSSLATSSSACLCLGLERKKERKRKTSKYTAQQEGMDKLTAVVNSRSSKTNMDAPLIGHIKLRNYDCGGVCWRRAVGFSMVVESDATPAPPQVVWSTHSYLAVEVGCYLRSNVRPSGVVVSLTQNDKGIHQKGNRPINFSLLQPSWKHRTIHQKVSSGK